MKGKKERVLVVVQDDVPGFARAVRELVDVLAKSGLEVSSRTSGDVRVPDFNAADILLFFLKPSLKNLIEYGRAFEAFPGMNCAGRLGGVLSTEPSRILDTLEYTLREADMTLVEPLTVLGLDSAGSGAWAVMKDWAIGLISRREEMTHEQRSPAR